MEKKISVDFSGSSCSSTLVDQKTRTSKVHIGHKGYRMVQESGWQHKVCQSPKFEPVLGFHAVIPATQPKNL